MARYIDADLLIETMQKRYDEICDTYGYHDLYASGYDDAVDAVDNSPAADVVPRAEVKRDLHDLLNYIRLNEDISKKCIEENGEENREYFKGKLSAFLQIRGFIDVELKKKYTNEVQK